MQMPRCHCLKCLGRPACPYALPSLPFVDASPTEAALRKSEGSRGAEGGRQTPSVLQRLGLGCPLSGALWGRNRPAAVNRRNGAKTMCFIKTCRRLVQTAGGLSGYVECLDCEKSTPEARMDKRSVALPPVSAGVFGERGVGFSWASLPLGRGLGLGTVIHNEQVGSAGCFMGTLGVT